MVTNQSASPVDEGQKRDVERREGDKEKLNWI